jgi:hypothetical protein
MKKRYNDYVMAALVLIGLAVAIMGLLLFTNRGDITSATLVLAGVACFMAGSFILTFYKGEGIDQKIAAALSLPGTLNLARLSADLGIEGDAYFIPVQESFPGGIMQFNPVSTYTQPDGISDASFYTEGEGQGIATVPGAHYLMDMLEHAYNLRIPGDEEGIFEAMREVAEDILEIADRVRVGRSGDTIVVELVNYHLISGCRKLREESMKCCTMAPCPVCSLMACIVAKGSGIPTSIESVVIPPGSKDIKILISKVPEQG